MLHQFITGNRTEIIDRCKAKIGSRPAPRATDAELEHGVPIFLDQLAATLRIALGPRSALVNTAAQHGQELLRGGFTLAQVVHDYGGVCQTITELALEMEAPITTREFQTLNLCLDEAIAAAVTEYGRLREHDGTERLGVLAHELRNLLNSAALAFDSLKSGSVGMGGSTAGVVTRSLAGLRDLIDRQLAEVRLGAGVLHKETVIVRELIEDVELAAALDARARGLQLSVSSVASDVTVLADRSILASVLANLLQNALKFTRAGGHVSLRASATADRVSIEVEDECGGMAEETVQGLFRPFGRRSTDRTGLGLGLAICHRGVRVNDGEIHVHNQPGTGCVFTVDVPRHPASAADGAQEGRAPASGR